MKMQSTKKTQGQGQFGKLTDLAKSRNLKSPKANDDFVNVSSLSLPKGT